MTRDYQKAVDNKEVTNPAVTQSQKFKDEGFFKEVTIKGFTSKNFDTGIKLFFPFDRFYKPMWYNAGNYNRLLTDGDSNVGYSRTNLIKTDILANITDWLRNVYLSSRLINVTFPNDGNFPPEVKGRTLAVPQDTKLQQHLKTLLSVIKGDGITLMQYE